MQKQARPLYDPDLVESRCSYKIVGVPPAHRIAGVSPAHRIAGVSSAHRIAGGMPAIPLRAHCGRDARDPFCAHCGRDARDPIADPINIIRISRTLVPVRPVINKSPSGSKK
jgi:hypothetical protein